MKSAIHSAAPALLAFGAVFSCLPVVTHAQPSDMPPKLEKIDELKAPAAAPGVTPSPGANKPGRQIIEKRERGQITSIEVRSGEHSYYINPGDQPGTVAPGEVQSGNTRTPQWKIFEFDLKRPAEPGNAAPNPAPAAPPAPVK